MAHLGYNMIIGRKQEQKLLEKAYQSKEAEFIVIYGRRRIGKTYLVREFFKNKKCSFFHATGLQEGILKKQLKKFTEAVSQAYFDATPLETPKNWDEAFSLLHKQISKANEKVILFLDELPWMATRKSGLLQEIDYYWNQYWSRMPNVILIVCGSSASWLIQKIIYNKGGLHNRVTCQIRLLPFSLSEVREYLKSRNIKLNNKHILSLYMAFGGVPYYLRYIDPGLTAEQNIQQIMFDKNSPLSDEFNKLFDSLFENSNAYIELVKLIAKKKEGVGRSELKSTAKLSTGGGRLSKRLQDLCETGFIEEYIPWGRNVGEYFKLIDEFCLFYLHWAVSQKSKKFTQYHWIDQSQRPSYYAWSGYAFEAVCLKHIDSIIHALKIRAASVGSWRFIPRKKAENGAQIDLVIDRNDNAITLCEIKYTANPFVIDKQSNEKLKHKIAIFKKKVKINKQIFLAIISANGLEKNIYAEEIVDGIVILEDLFRNDE
jgi:AAA+ ATPase superfamily predicted ATPase